MTTPRLIVDAIFVAALVAGGFIFNSQRLQLKAANEKYTKDIAEATSKVVIKNNTVEIFKKGKDGETIYKTIYLPAEGGTEVQCSSTGVASVMNKNIGWTFRPGMGLILGSYGFDWQIDSKFAYYGRYSAGLGFNTHAGSIWISRHIEDIVWNKASNAEVFIGYGVIRGSAVNAFSIGLRTNF